MTGSSMPISSYSDYPPQPVANQRSQNSTQVPGHFEGRRPTPHAHREAPPPHSTESPADMEESSVRSTVIYSPWVCCGMFSVLTAGYLVCAAIFVEGLLLLLPVHHIIRRDDSIFARLDSHNPFYDLQWTVLGVVAWGDLVLASMGAFGLWLCTYKLPLGWRKLSPYHALAVLVLIGLLLVYRVLVVIMAGPWVGLMLAFQSPEFGKFVYSLFTFIVILFNLWLLWILLQVFRLAVMESKVIQKELDEQAAMERKQLIWARMGNAPDESGQPPPYLIEEEPHIFGCIPLETGVVLYAGIIAVISFVSLVMLLLTGRCVGGWWLVFTVPKVDLTGWLVVCVYLFSLVFATLAILCIFYYRKVRRGEYKHIPTGEDGVLTYSEWLEQANRTKMRCVSYALVFFLCSLLRFGLLIPITGMALFDRNVCRLYVSWLSNLGNHATILIYGDTQLHCSIGDWISILQVAITMALDAYLIYSVLDLWDHYRREHLPPPHPGEGPAGGPAGGRSRQVNVTSGGYYGTTAYPGASAATALSGQPGSPSAKTATL